MSCVLSIELSRYEHRFRAEAMDLHIEKREIACFPEYVEVVLQSSICAIAMVEQDIYSATNLCSACAPMV